MNTCKTCKHWDHYYHGYKLAGGQGVCYNGKLCNDLESYAEDGATDGAMLHYDAADDTGIEADLCTGADFGCTLHEAKS